MKNVTMPAIFLLLGLGLFAVPSATTAEPEKAKESTAKPSDEYQDFVFLTEVRPLLIRVRVRLDGKTLRQAGDELFLYVFRYLDRNGDGFLSKDEADSVPTLEQIAGGGISIGLGGGGGAGRAAKTEPVSPTMADLDANKDGKVSVEELGAYYRKSGFVPFHFQLEQARGGGFNIATILGGARSEPTVESVRAEIFSALDTNNDGKLTRNELAAIASVLLKRDEDDDEIITTKEVVATAPAENPLAGFGGMMGRQGKKEPVVDSRLLVPIYANGTTTGLVRRLKERYGKSKDSKISRKQIGLDEVTFAALDADKDGVLDDKELAAFAGRNPDLELNLRLGTKDASQNRIEVVAGKGSASLTADQIAINNERLWVDLGLTRGEFRLDDVEPTYQIAEIVKQQYLIQFKQADTDNNGSLDEKEAKASRAFRTLFKAMDRDNDGKVTEKEVTDYLEEFNKIQAKSLASVTLTITDESRGLFDLIDGDRDSRLSLREMRQGPAILDKLDRTGKGNLTQDDIPRTYRLAIRRGSSNSTAQGAAAAFASLYSGNNTGEQRIVRTAGPAWFRKMDRNGDGDVSRREFLGSSEQFQKIDTDGDGLISLEEANRFDKQVRQSTSNSR